MSATLLSDKLKASLLQAAIQGKLTKQLPEDGDARDLLKQIEREKERLIAEKVIKKEKPLPPITADEIPFDIPDNWVWVRLGDLCLLITDGTHHTPKYTTSGVPFLSVKNITRGFLDLDKTKFISEIEHQQLIKRCNPKKGDLLLSKVGTTGVTLVIDTDIEFSIFVSLALLKLSKQIYNHFLCMGIKAPLVQEQAKSGTKGVGNKNWVLRDISKIIIPLPPLAEQYRIVEAIETALTKIDKLKADETKLYEIQKAFPRKLKASLLQSAIQGKLTTQLPEDGDARDLLRQIEREKERLIKEKVIKKEKPLPPITADEIPFDIPDNWVWVRFGDITLITSSKRVHQKDWKTDGIPFYRAREIARLSENSLGDNELFISEEHYKHLIHSSVTPQKDDLMVSGVGTLGKAYIVKENDVFYYKDASVLHVKNLNACNPKFLKFYMESDFLKKQILSNSSGTTVSTLTISRYKHYLIPLPPLAEQHRIVEVIETALGKIDTLTSVTE